MTERKPTPAQHRAATSKSPKILVLAGPGSGKTATGIARIENLMAQGIDPKKMVAVTFTNNAAKEMASRMPIVKASPNGDESMPYIDVPVELGHVGTLHSLALRMLKEHGACIGYGERMAIISPESAAEFLEAKAQMANCKAPMKQLLAIKGAGRPPRSSKLSVAEVAVAAYYDDLKTASIVDYDILLSEFLFLLTNPLQVCGDERELIAARFTHLLVDEVQDSSPMDWAIYDAFPAEHKYLTGDTDQAIFSFRGGSLAGILRCSEQKYCEVIRLEENFRSRSEICDAAQRMIEKNDERIRKATVSARGPGGLVKLFGPWENEGEEIAATARKIRELHDGGTPWSEIAVLARTNHLVNGFRVALPNMGVPVVTRSVQELPRDWKLARALVELIAEPDNDALAYFYLIAFHQSQGLMPKNARAVAGGIRKEAHLTGKTINDYCTHFSKVSRPELILQAMAGEKISRESQAVAAERYQELSPAATVLDFALALADVRERVVQGKEDGITTSTIHSAKGREFSAVFLAGMEDEVIPGRRSDADLQEERRLAFVAATRAKDCLFLSWSTSRVTPWKDVVKHSLSRFVLEMIDLGQKP